ncbi:TetR/AcrR family transcriptional regulator [Allobranchiibius sp. CTAmp26]|uniref:TetR/AcrR family transcriptional regulator n=1 Tax=Allobranchiibius sp. CTAmp26 TaxID=2815214 RepID=UPI001AA0E891|nr:TetR/AcrR family transcriptional regulator [Allobranchiibius sp. CTAmp26]MBO1755024.1 TetR/AcrR family transcriptional regulator C-terminal domain-containing protein [Allobranchiibius sp. CTAmp26]
MRQLKDGSSTGARRRLSLGQIVTATVAMIDEEGIAAASMRTVARRLRVQPMALYRYVENREDLFDAVVDHIVNELDHDPDIPRATTETDWRSYLAGLAWGVRRYARAHPHAFPLVATRPPSAPWINPPLRSLRWIETLLQHLSEAGFTDEQVLFTYRSFNSFLLGHLLLETSAMVIYDPRPGDGSFQAGDDSGTHDPVDPTDPVPGSISPTRTTGEREEIAAAVGEDTGELVGVDPDEYPVIHRLREGLTEDRFEAEFGAGLDILLSRIEAELTGGAV